LERNFTSQLTFLFSKERSKVKMRKVSWVPFFHKYDNKLLANQKKLEAATIAHNSQQVARIDTKGAKR